MRGLLAIGIALALSAAACGGRKAVAPPAPPPPQPTAVTPADRAYMSASAAMQEEAFEKALDMYAAAWKETAGYPGVLRDFPDALERLKRSGDEALKHGRPDEAGKRYSAALRFLPHPAMKGKTLPFTRADLKAGVDKASAVLMEKGLVEYRKGNLEAAISHWRALLAFDPSHEEAVKSLRTATVQLENLKRLTPAK